MDEHSFQVQYGDERVIIASACISCIYLAYEVIVYLFDFIVTVRTSCTHSNTFFFSGTNFNFTSGPNFRTCIGNLCRGMRKNQGFIDFGEY